MTERNPHGQDFKKVGLLVLAKRLALVLPVVFSIMVGVQVHGQILHATEPLPSFEVATIKPSQPGVTGIRAFGPKGADRFLAMNVTVKDLIDFAIRLTMTVKLLGCPAGRFPNNMISMRKSAMLRLSQCPNCLCHITHTDSCNRPYLLTDSTSKFTLKRGCYRFTHWCVNGWSELKAIG